ncbi:MAG: cbb3-type cytochrome c oxidase subunit 3 [Parvibaculum sp.]|uniref:cbb3-type cytochrome c oxidase subunit 3 n=1 Tax=Parvibaculum sp. TaxID=2024848 RepID=UPI002C100027|nr:cbb3-type cytochrome c oxidase subunit 3 [Parvibaculum sp.]HMM15074.1 cbb3-type cytochrome c oxidase subunit 3 [Parvibaculum sp.]
MMAHGFASAWAGMAGLAIFITLFVAALGYALWPSNARTFEHLARLPLNDDEGGPRP